MPPDHRHTSSRRNARSPAVLSRRAVLGAALAGAATIALPSALHAANDGEATPALAFDRDALIIARGGLRRSQDGGRTWVPLAAPDAGPVCALAMHPARPGRIVAGLQSGGIALSDDGGQSWLPRGNGLPPAPVTALTIAASQPDTLYAALAGDGLWRSADAGESWQFVMDRPWLRDAESEVRALASVNLASGMGGIWIYAGTEMGLTRVPDCFCRWQDVQPGDAMDALVSGAAPAPENPLPAGEPIHALVSAPSLPERLYAVLASGIWVSEDAGVVWAQRSTSRANAVAVHPQDADQVVAVTGDGLLESRDGGMSWTALANI